MTEVLLEQTLFVVYVLHFAVSRDLNIISTDFMLVVLHTEQLNTNCVLDLHKPNERENNVSLSSQSVITPKIVIPQAEVD